MNLEWVRDRTTAIKAAYESTRKVDRLNLCIEELNMKFGGANDVLSFDIFTYSTNTVTAWSQTIPIELYDTAKVFFKTLDDTLWNDIASEDIKMAGELVSEIFKNQILYDSKTFTFHYDGEPSNYERYMLELSNWEARSWWRRLVTTKPAIVYPTYINPSKVV